MVILIKSGSSNFCKDLPLFHPVHCILLVFQIPVVVSTINDEILNTSVFSAVNPLSHPVVGGGLGIFHFSLLVVSKVVVFSTIYHNTFSISQYSEASMCLFPSREENCQFIHFHFNVVLLLFQLSVVVSTIIHDNLNIIFDSEASTC